MAREGQPLALILGDLDYFKAYNDTYGHLAGDVCLKLVAQALDRAVRRPGDEVFRYGGEEFAVILPNTDRAGAMQVAQNIQQEVQRLSIAHPQSPISPHVTLSIGIASTIPQHPGSPELLFSASDRALYQAKERGRNTYCVQTVIEQSSQHDL
jgi:diguanylate cyclase (GGDEF)-like protein